MMVPAEYNIEVIRGGTFELPISITDDNGLVDLEATYDGARMHVRKAYLGPPVLDDQGDPVDPADPILDFTSEGLTPNIELDTTTLYIRMSAEETAAIPVAGGVYDLELYIDGTTEIVDKCLYGKFIVGKEATV